MIAPDAPDKQSSQWGQSALFIGGGLLAAIVVAWIAAQLHSYGHSPLGLISLGVGIALGITIYAIAASQRLAGRKRFIVATTVFAVLTVLVEHAWLYVEFRREWQQGRAVSAEAAMFRPETPWSPAEYFARELTPVNAALWALDAVLIVVGTVGVILVCSRRQHPTLTPDA